MKNIVLTGIMGTGKTTIGRVISKKLGRKFIDMDSEIERKQGMKIKEIFAEHGEDKFREIETEMARKLSQNSNQVISTGGGVVLRDENMDYLRSNGVIVSLMASPETVIKRTANNDDRPLLNVDDPLKKLSELLENRMPLYEKADAVVNTENRSPIMVAEEIIEIVNRLAKSE